MRAARHAAASQNTNGRPIETPRIIIRPTVLIAAIVFRGTAARLAGNPRGLRCVLINVQIAAPLVMFHLHRLFDEGDCESHAGGGCAVSLRGDLT